MTQSERIFTPFTSTFKMPFYYATLSSFKVYFKVATARVVPFLTGTGLKPARFKEYPGGDSTLASVEFQNYTGHAGNFLETCNEVEFNAIAYPGSREPGVPVMPIFDFIRGQEQTKLIGGMRLYVPADNKFAVQAGQDLFGEPKFYTNFLYNVPALNNPGVNTWQYSVMDPGWTPPPPGPKPPKPPQKDYIYTITADLQNLNPEPGNPSPITLYSMFPNNLTPGRKGYSTGKLIVSRWNIFGVDQIFMLPSNSGRVKLSCGRSKFGMTSDMQYLLGDGDAVAVQIFISPPAAVENRAFFEEVD